MRYDTTGTSLDAAMREARALERKEALEAVHAAISGYRWWGLKNIVATVRIFIQSCRLTWARWTR